MRLLPCLLIASHLSNVNRHVRNTVDKVPRSLLAVVPQFRPPLRPWTARPRYAYVWFCFCSVFHSALRSVVVNGRRWASAHDVVSAACGGQPLIVSLEYLPYLLFVFDMILFSIQIERAKHSPSRVICRRSWTLCVCTRSLRCAGTHANHDRTP